MVFEPRLHPPEPTIVGRVIHLRNGEVLLFEGRTLPSERLGTIGVVHHLGVLDGHSVIAVDVSDDPLHDGLDEFMWVPLRAAFNLLDNVDWVLAGRAMQILTWDRDHRLCGRCGTATENHPTDRAKRCPACGLMAFPRLSPAVIMLVHRGDEVLLAHGRQFPGRFYSALAGFVEPGESLEEAVAREVREEVGIEVADVRYFGSQPWPFPHSLMIGFTARWVSGELDPDPAEIVDAGWYGRDDLPPVPIGGMSIAGWLIQAWLDGV